MRTSVPRIERLYQPRAPAEYRVEFHLEGCSCEHCVEVPPALPVARLTFAAIAVGNCIAFAIDPAGAWAALRDAALHLLGAR